MPNTGKCDARIAKSTLKPGVSRGLDEEARERAESADRERRVAQRTRPLAVRQPVTRETELARRSLPDGVLGMLPGPSTTTLRGRMSTSETTSWAT